jgi:GxxExxY protein
MICLQCSNEPNTAMNLFESDLTAKVIGCAIEVHRAFGPGLLESAYRECLFNELRLNGLSVEREKPPPIMYKGLRLDHGYWMDLLVEKKLVAETKTVGIFYRC